ncbi:methylaspartate mutase [Amycolatopsis antarctica]|uniref:Methylaspartate mutase n=2 Tax=Amycolatopsis antarctica TaxID=1854586 RepID=A0A263D4B4_9PSEU|nr:methylaspartate mutase [Amycolatopsis antarctica]
MGMHDPGRMRAGLRATRAAAARSVGTITLDSYTRTGDLGSARRALDEGIDLNGFPIVSHGPELTRAMLDGVCDGDFPVQVRHGSAAPQDIFSALMRAGIDATEGGPVSYCLPYSRTPLSDSVANWAACCRLLAELPEFGVEPHLETFGGCMLGQLCPPSLLVAISLLEGMFFRQHGIRSVSLSYAQQTHAGQDEEAILSLHRLAGELLGDHDWHVVLYTYMGVYPSTSRGANALLAEAADLAVRTGAARLIVKTVAESYRIPTVQENVSALEYAAAVARRSRRSMIIGAPSDTGIYEQAWAIVQAVLDLDADLGVALCRAFELGYLDVPYCLHPDNARRTRSRIARDGRLVWAEIGSLPIAHALDDVEHPELGSSGLLSALSYVVRKFDGDLLEDDELPTADLEAG